MTSPSDGARWRELLLYQSYCHLRLEAERLYVGYLWWAIEPLLEMTLLYVVFRAVLGQPMEHYLAFLLTGLVAWRWLAQSATRAAPAILQNQPLASQVYVPKLVFPFAMLIADAVRFGAGLAVLLVFLFVDGFAPTAHWLALPFVLAVELIFIAAVSLWAAALVPFFRSVLVGVDVALRFGMFASGVFFDIRTIAEPLRGWLSVNPMAVLLDAWRDVLLRGVWPNWLALVWIAALSAVAIAGVYAFVQRRELVYPRLPA